MKKFSIGLVVGIGLAVILGNRMRDDTVKDLRQQLVEAELEGAQEHDIRTGEGPAWTLAHYPSSDVSRDICQKKSMATRAGSAIVDCHDADGKKFVIQGLDDSGTPVVIIGAPSSQREGPLANPITDPNDKRYLGYTLLRKPHRLARP